MYLVIDVLRSNLQVSCQQNGCLCAISSSNKTMKIAVSVVCLLFYSWLSIQPSMIYLDRLCTTFMLQGLSCLHHLRLFIICVTSTKAFVLTSQEREDCVMIEIYLQIFIYFLLLYHQLHNHIPE